MNEQPAKIYKTIPAIMSEVGAITKNRKNQQQGYSFRGIDDAYFAFQPLFAKHGLFVVPSVMEMTREERQAKTGGVLIYTVLKVKHTFYADDGSSIESITVGEAMDSGDKSCNKSESAAMKYALLEVFCVPTVADNDTENNSPEPAPRRFEDLPPQSPSKAIKTPPSEPQSEKRAFEGDWRQVVITFGKNKGTTLGELSPQSLSWYMEKADVGKDTPLRNALNAAAKELQDDDQLPM